MTRTEERRLVAALRKEVREHDMRAKRNAKRGFYDWAVTHDAWASALTDAVAIVLRVAARGRK